MFKDIEEQNALEEQGIEAQLRALDKLTVQHVSYNTEQIKPVGDPFAGFARGINDY